MDVDDEEEGDKPDVGTIGGDYRAALKRKDDGEDHPSDYSPDSDAPLTLDAEGDHEMEEPHGETLEHVLPLRRLRKKTRGPKPPGEVMLTRKALTHRGQAKRQEKELRWDEIPQHARPLFKEAEKVQWQEHLSYDALEPLDATRSQWVRDNVPADRILPCRWASRDKNWAARKSAGSEAGTDETSLEMQEPPCYWRPQRPRPRGPGPQHGCSHVVAGRACMLDAVVGQRTERGRRLVCRCWRHTVRLPDGRLPGER